MAPLKDELSYSQLVKEAKRLDGLSNPTRTVPTRSSSDRKHTAPKGVKIQRRAPRVLKHTRVEPRDKGDDSGSAEFKQSIIEAIREELRNFTPSTSSRSVDSKTETLYIPREDGEIEANIKSTVSSEKSDISKALEKLKRLKERE